MYAVLSILDVMSRETGESFKRAALSYDQLSVNPSNPWSRVPCKIKGCPHTSDSPSNPLTAYFLRCCFQSCGDGWNGLAQFIAQFWREPVRQARNRGQDNQIIHLPKCVRRRVGKRQNDFHPIRQNRPYWRSFIDRHGANSFPRVGWRAAHALRLITAAKLEWSSPASLHPFRRIREIYLDSAGRKNRLCGEEPPAAKRQQRHECTRRHGEESSGRLLDDGRQ